MLLIIIRKWTNKKKSMIIRKSKNSIKTRNEKNIFYSKVIKYLTCNLAFNENTIKVSSLNFSYLL